MTLIGTFLQACARHAKWLLVLSLVVGVLFPETASFVRPWIPQLIAVLLFSAAVRTDLTRLAGRRELILCTKIVGVHQLLLPLAAVLVISLTGLNGIWAAAIVLMLAAAPISGSPNLTILSGGSASSSITILIISMVFLPLTVVPVFLAYGGFGSPDIVFVAALRLLALIAGCYLIAILFRRYIYEPKSERSIQIADGTGALFMAILVLALMDAVGPALRETPLLLLVTLAFACALNFGMQIASSTALKGMNDHRTASGIAAGNRNIAIFLAALPVSVTDPLLLFIGCYQVPMYLTPLIMGPYYRWRNSENP
ncbi:MAG: hypothetical protein AAF468_19860 [Pseudomonadota bacterium]